MVIQVAILTGEFKFHYAELKTCTLCMLKSSFRVSFRYRISRSERGQVGPYDQGHLIFQGLPMLTPNDRTR